MLSPGQDIPSRLLAQHKPLLEWKQFLHECKQQQQQALKETLEGLKLKFRQPPQHHQVLLAWGQLCPAGHHPWGGHMCITGGQKQPLPLSCTWFGSHGPSAVAVLSSSLL